MKRFFCIPSGIAAITACLLFINPALAQDNADPASEKAESAAQHHMQPVLERMIERLDLTDEQTASVKAILAEHKESIKALGERRRAMQDELKTSLEEVLTEEQMEKLDKPMSGDKNRRRKTMEGKRGRDRDHGKHMRGRDRDHGKHMRGEHGGDGEHEEKEHQ